MSLARAFTKRREKRSVDAADAPSPYASPFLAARNMRDSKMVNRTKISGPVALLATTNMLAYNAPDIEVYRQQKQASAARQVSASSTSSSSSNHSDSSSVDDSDRSSVSSQNKDSFLTDASSVDENSPTDRSPSPEDNHLTRYFPSTKTVRRSISASELSPRLPSTESPAIPQRAPSHSKRAHELSLARKRSLQTWERENVNSTTSVTPSLQSSNLSVHARNLSGLSTRSSTNLRSSYRDSNSLSRTSADIFRANIDPNHPFGKELEQLNEVAEEFVDVVRDAEWEADSTFMKQRGLVRFCANDYLQEISPLFSIPAFYAPLVSTDGGFF